MPFTARAKVIESWNFEGKDPLHGLTIEGEKPRVVTDANAPTNHVMESILCANSERQERSEVRWDSIGYGLERWVAVRIRFPDPNPQPLLCLFQIGPIKNSKDIRSAGFIQLQVVDPGENWITRIFLERVHLRGVKFQTGPVTLGKVDLFVMHFCLSNDQKGFVEIWRNGLKVYENSGPNAKPGDHVPLKWGVYIGIGNRIKQNCRVFFDDIVLGDETSSYQEVAGETGRSSSGFTPRGSELAP